MCFVIGRLYFGLFPEFSVCIWQTKIKTCRRGLEITQPIRGEISHDWMAVCLEQIWQCL